MSYIAERRQEEKERRRAEILDATEAVAAKVGWDALTMDQVARKARLSRALLYVYFKDKQDLLFGICERALATLRQRFAEAVGRQKRGLDQIVAIGRAYIAFSQEFPVYFEVIARCEMVSPNPEENTNEGAATSRGDEARQLMVDALRTGVADGSIRPDVGDVRLVSNTLWAFTHGVLQLAATKANVLLHDGVTIKDFVEHALVMATRSIEARP
ncbi:MAG TPA: TetR/AcrR family transcriptional regulator [Steroidobacteraceae bacterium]|nr:TetR/AcrR family transcriptional regulator [Steroidobacteraceae bacterium]